MMVLCIIRKQWSFVHIVFTHFISTSSLSPALTLHNIEGHNNDFTRICINGWFYLWRSCCILFECKL